MGNGKIKYKMEKLLLLFFTSFKTMLISKLHKLLTWKIT